MTDQKAPKGNIALIRDFFGEGKHGRKVEITEIKAAPAEDRLEMANLIKEGMQDGGIQIS